MAAGHGGRSYPRQGERIAPVTLGEVLLEPISEALDTVAARRPAGPASDIGRLCDLDQSAWERFPRPVVLELAEAVIDRVAAGCARHAFDRRHFPQPPAGLTLDQLPLEHRTKSCLRREGFDRDLGRLGRMTIGQVLAMRAFGPRCLVDLLAALESRATRPERLDPDLTAAADRLRRLPGAERVDASDPRFGELIHAIDVEAGSALALAERLIGREHDPPDAAYATGRLEALRVAIERATQVPLEDELAGIFAADASPRNRDILIGYYGWADGQRHTLTEVGRRFGITRERTRQICAKLTRRFGQLDNLWTPVLQRTLDLIASRLPCRADRLEAELAELGLTRVGLPLESIAVGAELLGRDVPFQLVTIDRGTNNAPPDNSEAVGATPRPARLAVSPGNVDMAKTAADVARREVYYHGIARVATIRRATAEKCGARVDQALVRRALELNDGFRWLEESKGWFHLTSVARHGLPKILDKVLAVAERISVSLLREAMARNRRMWSEPPPEDVLLAYCRQAPGVRVEGRRLIAEQPRDWRQVLTGVEAQLVQALSEHGPVLDRGTLEDLCVRGGMNRFSFHAFLAWSPVVAQYGHSIYGLLGSRVSEETLRQLGEKRRAERINSRVLEDHGVNRDGTVWLKYRLSKAASTYAVITIPAALKEHVEGRFELFDDSGESIGTLATKDGRAWGLGSFLRERGADSDDEILLTIDPARCTAEVTMLPDST